MVSVKIVFPVFDMTTKSRVDEGIENFDREN